MPASVGQDWPQHVRVLISNTTEVGSLIRMHGAFTQGRKGRPVVPLATLNKSAIVLLVACWEAFIEDLSAAAFDAMLGYAKTPQVFPDRVLALSSRHLKEDQNGTSVWALAQEGWRKVLSDHKQELFDRYIGRLNTPRPAQVDALMESLVGLRSLSKYWNWKGRSNASVIVALENLVTLRGEIAHRVQTSRAVRKSYIIRSLSLINRIAAISSNQVSAFIQHQVGERPWVGVTYGKTG